MIVIARDTEQKLLEELHRARREGPRQACYYLAFSKAQQAGQALFEPFFRALHGLPNAYMAQIFICHDKDVFILMQGFMQRHFHQVISGLTRDIKDANIGALAHIFEIGHDWQTLEDLCQAKLDCIRKQDQQRNQEAQNRSHEKMLQDTLDSLDRALIASLTQRRAAHDVPAVLIVDDDQLSRTLAGNVLREHFVPHFAKDGAGALREFVACAPHVVFLDIGMPDMSGHDVLDCLFRMDPDAYVIMFSGRKDKENMIRAFESGAQGFIGKPFTREDLYRHMARAPFSEPQKTALAKADETSTPSSPLA